MNTIILIAFIIGYGLIALESKVKINKAAEKILIKLGKPLKIMFQNLTT